MGDITLHIYKLISVQWWIEGLWRNRRPYLPHQFPNYVRSIKRDFTLPHKERRLLYSFPSAKTSGAETFARAAPDITLLRVHFIDNLYRSFYQALSADPLHN